MEQTASQSLLTSSYQFSLLIASLNISLTMYNATYVIECLSQNHQNVAMIFLSEEEKNAITSFRKTDRKQSSTRITRETDRSGLGG